MSTSYSASPSGALPGTVTGKPVRLPFVLVCTQGEVFCGKTWTACTPRQFAEMAAEKREHEKSCGGGLVAARRGQIA